MFYESLLECCGCAHIKYLISSDWTREDFFLGILEKLLPCRTLFKQRLCRSTLIIKILSCTLIQDFTQCSVKNQNFKYDYRRYQKQLQISIWLRNRESFAAAWKIRVQLISNNVANRNVIQEASKASKLYGSIFALATTTIFIFMTIIWSIWCWARHKWHSFSSNWKWTFYVSPWSGISTLHRIPIIQDELLLGKTGKMENILEFLIRDRHVMF